MNIDTLAAEMRTKTFWRLLMTVTLLNSVALLSLLGVRLWDFRQQSRSAKHSELPATYASMNATELSTRFARPDLFESRDDFARANALKEILERRIVRRGMNADEVRLVLGAPNSSITAEGTEGLRLGEPFSWHYDNLPASGLVIHFGADEKVLRIRWIFDDAPDGVSRTREY